jgi:hypothetical protein
MTETRDDGLAILLGSEVLNGEQVVGVDYPMGSRTQNLQLDLASCVNSTKSRGSKITTPRTTAGLRRGLRSDKDGYVELSLPNQPTRRKASNVPLALKPAVLQIREMQRIGVQDCGVNPDDLSEEHLRRERAA